LTAKPKRVGLFGGAFDPPHLGHLALVETALSQLKLDELRVLPTGDAWHKARALSPAEHRLNMAQLAFGHLAGVQIDDREIRRAGASYTIDTLRELQASESGADWFLLLGMDQVRALASWKDYQALLDNATICIAERHDSSRPKDDFDPSVSFRGRFVRLQMAENPVSATQIRELLAKGKNVSPLVGPAVARYIAQHHLYSTSA
jgi:nicotinate-nucleotide adenylyltransferase